MADPIREKELAEVALREVLGAASRYLARLDDLPAKDQEADALASAFGWDLRLARRLADQVKASDDFELLEEPVLNVVCFRYRPHGVPDEALDALNRRLGEVVLQDRRVYFGTTVYAGKVAFRPAVSNWRSLEHDVDLILPIARELGARLRTAVT